MKDLEKHRRYLQKEFGIGKKSIQQPTHESIEDKESMNIMSSINQPDDEEFQDIVINESSSRALTNAIKGE